MRIAFVYNILILAKLWVCFASCDLCVIKDQEGHRKLIKQGAVAMNQCLQKIPQRHCERKNTYKSIEEWNVHIFNLVLWFNITGTNISALDLQCV